MNGDAAPPPKSLQSVIGAMLFAAEICQRMLFFLSVSSGCSSFKMRVIILSLSASP